MKQHRIAFRAVLSQLRPLNFLLLLAAGIVNAVGVTMFLAPVQLYDSGISGTSMLLWQVTPEEYTLSLFLLLLNIPLFLFGLKKQGAVFTIGGIAFLTPMSRLLGADETMLPVCVSYGRIVLLGLIPYMLQNTFQSFLVTAERPQLGLYVTIAAGVTNIVLDTLFVASL